MASYPPAPYVEHDRATLLDFLRHHPLATFIVADGSIPYATPLPLVLTADGGQLIGHLDANGPAATLVTTGRPALAVFHGPSSYISPDDYTTRQLPTYNYQQVHVRGTLLPVTDDGFAEADLRTLIAAMEGRNGWQLPTEDPRVKPLLPQIVAFRLQIDDIVGRFKLSQDKRPADRDAAHAKLEHSMGCPVLRAPSTR